MKIPVSKATKKAIARSVRRSEFEDFVSDLSARNLPGIARATLEMSYCNGGIHRGRREKDVLRELDALLSGGPDVAFDLPKIDRWLAALADDDLLTVVDGEEGEAAQLLQSAPPGTDMLLNSIFERAA